MSKILGFFHGIKKETEKIKWPTGKDLLLYSSVVIVMIVFFCAFFYGLDVVFAFLKGLIN